MMPTVPNVTIALCKECGNPVSFFAGAAPCPSCRTWNQLLNSPMSGLTRTKKKRRRKRGW